jgi:hypothetical protein
MSGRIRLAVSIIAAVALGLISIIAPVFVLSRTHYDAPLFPLVRSGIEGMSSLTFAFLLVSGVLLGIAFPRHPLLLGICTMAAFPLLAIAEISVSPTSHNLWPFEFVIYGLVSLIAVLGAFIGRFIYRRTHKPSVAA